MDISFDDIFEPECFWLYFTPLFGILALILWLSTIHYFKERDPAFYVMFVMYLFMILGENLSYFNALQKQPMEDWNFWVARFLSLIIFYSAILILLYSFLSLFKKGFMNLAFFITFRTIIFCCWLIHISFALAYSSPAGIIYSVLSFILSIVKIVVIPSSIPKRRIIPKKVIISSSSSESDDGNQNSEEQAKEINKEKTE